MSDRAVDVAVVALNNVLRMMEQWPERAECDELVREVLDQLTGYCHPAMRLVGVVQGEP